MATNGLGRKIVDGYGSNIPDKIKPYYKGSKADFIGQLPEDPKPIIYLSGTAGAKEWSEADFTKATGCYHRCFSYAYTGPDSPMRAMRHMEAMDWCIRNGVHVFMDSGAHSFHGLRYYGRGLTKNLSKSERNAAIDKMMAEFKLNYAKYIRWCYGVQKYHFDFYVTLDAEKRCAFIRNMTDELFKLGIRPIPVYHGDASIDYVARYIDDGHKLIGVGVNKIGKNSPDAVRRYYDRVLTFCGRRGAVCHGFAVTGDVMFDMPWYSVDSTTWLKAGAYGKLVDIIPEKQRVALIHVSNRAISQGYGTVEGLAPSVRKYLRDKVEAAGFDWDMIRKDLSTRATYNAKVMVDAVNANAKKQLKFETWQPVI